MFENTDAARQEEENTAGTATEQWEDIDDDPMTAHDPWKNDETGSEHSNSWAWDSWWTGWSASWRRGTASEGSWNFEKDDYTDPSIKDLPPLLPDVVLG